MNKKQTYLIQHADLTAIRTSWVPVSHDDIVIGDYLVVIEQESARFLIVKGFSKTGKSLKVGHLQILSVSSLTFFRMMNVQIDTFTFNFKGGGEIYETGNLVACEGSEGSSTLTSIYKPGNIVLAYKDSPARKRVMLTQIATSKGEDKEQNPFM